MKLFRAIASGFVFIAAFALASCETPNSLTHRRAKTEAFATAPQDRPGLGTR